MIIQSPLQGFLSQKHLRYISTEEKAHFQKCYLDLLANYSFRVQTIMNCHYFKACYLLCMSCGSWKLCLFPWDKKGSKATRIRYFYTWGEDLSLRVSWPKWVLLISLSRLACCLNLGSRLSRLWRGRAEHKRVAPLALPVPNPRGRRQHGFGRI